MSLGEGRGSGLFPPHPRWEGGITQGDALGSPALACSLFLSWGQHCCLPPLALGFHRVLYVQMQFDQHHLTLPNPVPTERQRGDGGRREMWGLADPEQGVLPHSPNPGGFFAKGWPWGIISPPRSKADFVLQPHLTAQGVTCARPALSRLLGGAGAGALQQLNPPGSQPRNLERAREGDAGFDVALNCAKGRTWPCSPCPLVSPRLCSAVAPSEWVT